MIKRSHKNHKHFQCPLCLNISKRREEGSKQARGSLFYSHLTVVWWGPCLSQPWRPSLPPTVQGCCKVWANLDSTLPFWEHSFFLLLLWKRGRSPFTTGLPDFHNRSRALLESTMWTSFSRFSAEVSVSVLPLWNISLNLWNNFIFALLRTTRSQMLTA